MKLKKICSVIFASAFVSIMLTTAVSARVIIDFSKNDYVMDSIGGQGEMEVISDGDKRVVFAECTDGYDPDVDPDSTNGDLYASITDFEDYGLDADALKWMKISVKNESNAPYFEFHFASPTSGYHVATSVNLEIEPNNGGYKEYVYNVPEQSKKYYPKRPENMPAEWEDHWQGIISGFRVDFMYYDESGGHARTGDKIYIEYIGFFETEEAANSFVFTPVRTTAQIAQEQAEKDAAHAEALAVAEAALAADNADDSNEAANANDNAANDGEAVNADAADTNEDITTSSSVNRDEETGGNMIMWIAIGAGVIVLIIIIAVVATKKK